MRPRLEEQLDTREPSRLQSSLYRILRSELKRRWKDKDKGEGVGKTEGWQNKGKGGARKGVHNGEPETRADAPSGASSATTSQDLVQWVALKRRWRWNGKKRRKQKQNEKGRRGTATAERDENKKIRDEKKKTQSTGTPRFIRACTIKRTHRDPRCERTLNRGTRRAAPLVLGRFINVVSRCFFGVWNGTYE